MTTVERLRRRHPVPSPLPSPRPTELAQQGMTPREIADALAKIEQQARRLRPPLRQEPESFHEDKSELLRLLRLLEAAVRRGLPCPEHLR
jgi:hypothetical protein